MFVFLKTDTFDVRMRSFLRLECGHQRKSSKFSALFLGIEVVIISLSNRTFLVGTVTTAQTSDRLVSFQERPLFRVGCASNRQVSF